MRCLIVVFLLALAGCVRYQPQPLAPVEWESQFRARSLADRGLQSFAQSHLTNPPVAWPPAQFDLQSLTVAALYFHPDMQLASARLQLSCAAEVTAGARLNPVVTFFPTWVANSFAGEEPWLFAISADIPFETAGKRRRRIEAARAATVSAGLDLAAAAWSVRARLRAALVEYFCAQRALELMRSQAALESDLTNLLSRRFEAGEVSRFELAQAQTGLLEAVLAQRTAETRAADARLTVAEALGLPASALDKTRLSWTNFDQPPAALPLNGLQSVAAFERLDLTRARAQYAVADALLRVEISKQYPDLHLEPGYEFDQGEHKFSLGPSFAIPLFDRNQGSIAEALARRRVAALNFMATQEGAIQDFEKAAADYKLAVVEFQQAAAVSENLNRSVTASIQRQLQLGDEDRVTLYYTRLQQFAAAQASLDALRKVQDALGALENAVQWPLDSPDDWRAVSQYAPSQPKDKP